MPNPASDAAELQDTAASRMLPVWTSAVAAARASTPAPSVDGAAPSLPPALGTSLHIAIVAALVAAFASLRRRTELPDTPPHRLQNTEDRASKIADQMAEHVWAAAVEHTANQDRSTDTAFAKRASYTSAAELMSRAQLELADELGMKYKVWISRGDAKVRDLHRRLHGRPVQVGRAFRQWPDGQELRFPGDPEAPLDATMNCRCIMFLAPSRANVVEALGPANMQEAFSLAASIEERWTDDGS